MPWAIFSRRWWPITLLLLAGSLLCVRLGLWQLDRLAQRRALNARLALITSLPPATLPETEDLADQEYRAVRFRGTYDFHRQVALRNQARDGEYGFHLLTPLLLQDAQNAYAAGAVVVDRGWIPAEGNLRPDNWRKYDVPGVVTVTGVVRLGREIAPSGVAVRTIPAVNELASQFALAVDTAQMSEQLGYELLPFYIQAGADDPGSLPAAQPPILDLSDGPHLGYAIQWFSFALFLVAGYGLYVRRQENVDS
jgi:surfeit locus 1 family protein